MSNLAFSTSRLQRSKRYLPEGSDSGHRSKRQKRVHHPTIHVHAQQIFDAEEISGVFGKYLIHDTPEPHNNSRACNLLTGETYRFADNGIVAGAVNDRIYVRKKDQIFETLFEDGTENDVTPTWFNDNVGYCRIFEYKSVLTILFELQNTGKICVANLREGGMQVIGELGQNTQFGKWGSVLLHVDCRFVVINDRFFFQSEFQIAECLFDDKMVQRIPCFDGTCALLLLHNTLFSFRCKNLSSLHPEQNARKLKLVDEFGTTYKLEFSGTNPSFSGYLVNVQLDQDFYVLAEDGVHKLTIFSPFLWTGKDTWGCVENVFSEVNEITLICKDGELRGRKELLISRCEFFRGLYAHGTEDSMIHEFTYPDITKETMLKFLRWVQFNTVQFDDAIEGLKLFKVANEFMCEELINITGNRIVECVANSVPRESIICRSTICRIMHEISVLGGKYFAHLHDYLFKFYIQHPSLMCNPLNRGRTLEKLTQLLLWFQHSHNEQHRKEPIIHIT